MAQAFRWTAASGMVGLGFLAGSIWNAALGVNGDGTVVVGYSLTDPQQATRWTSFTFAGVPGSKDCQGKSLSALAQKFSGLSAAAIALGFSMTDLQAAIKAYCG